MGTATAQPAIKEWRANARPTARSALLSLFSGHVFEVAEAVGLKESNDQFGLFDTDIAQDEMRKGFQCRG